MLPPVPASPSSYVTATEPKLRPDQPAAPRPATVPSPAAPTALNQNSAIAGQLNIMLLSGPERMSQNLAALAEVLGTALKIEQRGDESLNDYMRRLIDGIAALPQADRLKLQKLLTQSFAGLQLRTLLEAMANPSGPERATLALYLELYRQTDRDGAMRSVISSYREVAADGRSNAASANRPLAANDGGRASSDPQLPARTTVQQDQPSRMPGVETAGRAEVRSANVAPPLRPSPDTAPLPRVATAAAPPPPPQGYDITSENPADSAVPVRSETPQKAVTEQPVARGLQVASPSSAAPQNAELQAEKEGQRAVAPIQPVVDSEEKASDSARTADRSTPSIAAAIPAPGQARPAAAMPTSWLAELFETDFVRTLLQLKTLSPDPQAPARSGSFPGSDAPSTPVPKPEATPTDDAAVASEQTAPMPEVVARDLAEERPLPVFIPVPDQAPLRFPVAREGMPLPFVPYLIADEFETERIKADEDEDKEGGNEQNAGQEAGDEPAEDDAEEALATAVPGPMNLAPDPDAAESAVPEVLALQPPSETTLQLPPEPAHELYLRMAGLT
ncbi:MAG: hypothetical protein QE484_05810 [Rhizobium sp.]|nr:hypothetical protein [Rhizobium sp.]